MVEKVELLLLDDTKMVISKGGAAIVQLEGIQTSPSILPMFMVLFFPAFRIYTYIYTLSSRRKVVEKLQQYIILLHILRMCDDALCYISQKCCVYYVYTHNNAHVLLCACVFEEIESIRTLRGPNGICQTASFSPRAPRRGLGVLQILHSRLLHSFYSRSLWFFDVLCKYVDIAKVLWPFVWCILSWGDLRFLGFRLYLSGKYFKLLGDWCLLGLEEWNHQKSCVHSDMLLSNCQSLEATWLWPKP